MARAKEHLRGHVFSFERRCLEPISDSSGVRVILLYVVFEWLIGPRLGLLSSLGIWVPPAWMRVPALLGAFWLSLRTVGRVGASQVGLIAWRNWTLVERSYAAQILVLATVVFGGVFWSSLSELLARPDRWPLAILLLVTSLGWGFYQELIYRGVLQTELVRRWGVAAGLVTSNLLFTFGPLHFTAYQAPLASAAVMLSAIFATGLFFGVLFQRSQNLWLVGLFHGLGNWFTSSLPTVVS